MAIKACVSTGGLGSLVIDQWLADNHIPPSTVFPLGACPVNPVNNEHMEFAVGLVLGGRVDQNPNTGWNTYTMWYWDTEAERPRNHVSAANLRCLDSQAVVDATPDIRELADAWAQEKEFERTKAQYEIDSKVIKLDRYAVVLDGPRVADIGRVFWLRDGRAGLTNLMPDQRVEGKYTDAIWVKLNQIAVYNSGQYMPSVEAMLDEVKNVKWQVP